MAVTLTPIFLGSAPDDGTGDVLRLGGQKINDNFSLTETHINDTNNPHLVDQSDIGLSNVTNNKQIIANPTYNAGFIPLWATDDSLTNGLQVLSSITGTSGNIPTEGAVSNLIDALTTDDIAEGGNLYYTEVRVSANIDVSANTTYRNIGHVPLSEKGAANGVATLDGSGKVPASQLPNSVQNGIRVVGFWDANANTPDLTALTLDAGEAYQVSVSGSTDINGETNWKVRDLVVWSDDLAGNWFKIDNTDDVLSVNGFTGSVVLTTTNINEGTNLYYTEARVSANTDVTANSAYRSVGHIPTSEKGAVNGVATLNASGTLESAQAPDNIRRAANPLTELEIGTGANDFLVYTNGSSSDVMTWDGVSFSTTNALMNIYNGSGTYLKLGNDTFRISGQSSGAEPIFDAVKGDFSVGNNSTTGTRTAISGIFIGATPASKISQQIVTLDGSSLNPTYKIQVKDNTNTVFRDLLSYDTATSLLQLGTTSSGLNFTTNSAYFAPIGGGEWLNIRNGYIEHFQRSTTGTRDYKRVINFQGGAVTRIANEYFTVDASNLNPRYKLEMRDAALAADETIVEYKSIDNTYSIQKNLRLGSAVAATEALDVTGNAKVSGVLEVDGSGDSYFTGMLGVGTQTPEASIHISDSSPSFTITDTDTGADFKVIADSSVGGVLLSADANNEVANSYLRFAVDGSIVMSITDDKYVGIGTTSPLSPLAVVGLPTSSAGLTSGNFYTQTATELGGSGTTKVVCVV